MWKKRDSSWNKSIQWLVSLTFPSLLSHIPSPHAKTTSSSHLPHLFLLLYLLLFSFLPSYTLCLLLNIVYLKQNQQKRGETELKDYIRGRMAYMGSGRSHPPHIHMLSILAYLVCGSCWQTEGRCATAQCLQMFISSKRFRCACFREKVPYTKWIMCKSVMSFKLMHYL